VEHGTITVVQHDAHGGNVAVEVTTFRTEGGYQDGRRPDQVTFVRALEEDLSRRDFTINAMALHVWPHPKLTDPFDGAGDLNARVLRTVGKAQDRFNEDGLRAVRAARFAAQLQLQSAPGLEDAVQQALSVVKKVAPERFFQELRKLFEKATTPSRGLLMLARTQLLQFMAPQAPTDESSLTRVDHVPPSLLAARFSAWLWDAGPVAAKDTLKTLRASVALTEDVAALTSLPRPVATQHATPAQLRQMVRVLQRARLIHASALWATQDGGVTLVERVEAALQKGFVASPAGLALDGHALQTLTGARGKALGDLLRALLDAVDEDPDANQPAALQALAQKLHPR